MAMESTKESVSDKMIKSGYMGIKYGLTRVKKVQKE